MVISGHFQMGLHFSLFYFHCLIISHQTAINHALLTQISDARVLVSPLQSSYRTNAQAQSRIKSLKCLSQDFFFLFFFFNNESLVLSRRILMLLVTACLFCSRSWTCTAEHQCAKLMLQVLRSWINCRLDMNCAWLLTELMSVFWKMCM